MIKKVDVITLIFEFGLMQSVSGASEFHTIVAELLSHPLCVSIQFLKVHYCVCLFFFCSI